METNTNLSRRDFVLVTFIGISFGLFSIPILNNIKLAFLPLNLTTYLILIVFFGVSANIAIAISAYIGRSLPVIFQFAKFAAVGAFNTFLDWGIMNILIALTGIATGLGYSTFKGLSFVVSNIGSYFWNKYWTFEKKDKSTSEEVKSFILVSLIGLIINILFASLIVFFFAYSGIESKRLANIGAAVATIASLIWNFLGYKFFVFKKEEQPR